MLLRLCALGAMITFALLAVGCADEGDAEQAAEEFSSLAAEGDSRACEFVEPERLEELGECRAFLDELVGGPGATACLQQLDVTRSSASPDGTVVVAFDCGPTSPSDGEAESFGEYELVEDGGEYLIRDGYVESG